MTERELQDMRQRIADALAEDGIEVPSDKPVVDHIIAAIEWDAVIVSTEEWNDVRTMRETISELNDIVVEWAK
jgi:hypothetical protein